MKTFPQDFHKIDGIWIPKEGNDNIAYTDGKKAEDYVRTTIENAEDLSSTSPELQQGIRDWSSRYHLSATRGNLFRALSMRSGAEILELGSGCGAITRCLGEHDVKVTAVEGSHDRARISHSRCRDLDNVDVVSGNFDDLAFEKKFDIATLIGVLEYSHMFCRGQDDPFSWVLKSAWNHLNDDGVLVIAIENQLGLKYMSGCGEDHLGTRFVGIEGYPDDAGARTFGKQGLIDLVESCGFVDHELLLPFPDYKVPSTLINAKSCSAKDAKRLNLADWCRQPYEDYTNNREYLFHDHLGIETMAVNGLLADHANSFLLIASKKPLTDQSPVKPIKWDAKKLNVTRLAKFQTETTLEAKGQEYIVNKKGMNDFSDRSSLGFSLVMAEEAPYVESGRSLSLEMIRSIRRSDQTIERYQTLVAEWVQFLVAQTNQEEIAGQLPAHYLDCIPDNLIRNASDELVYIDTEWHWNEPVPVEWVVFRGLWVFWSANKRWLEKVLMQDGYRFKNYLDDSLKNANLSISAEQLEIVAQLEATFQSGVYGGERSVSFKRLISNKFGGAEELNNDALDEYYSQWIHAHALQEIDGQLFAERMMLKWTYRPVLHFAMMVFPGEETLLADTLDSLNEQMYQEWRLTVVSESSAPDPLWAEMDELEWLQFSEGDNPYELLNKTLAESSGDWVAYIEPGISLAPQALVQVGDYINIRPDWKLIYSDEDVISSSGHRSEPKFKPDFNLDLLRSMPYIGNFCLIEKQAFIEIDGIHPYFSAENYDLALRVFDRFNELSIGHVSDVLFHAQINPQRSYDAEIGLAAVQHHLDRNKIAAKVTAGYVKNTTRVIYQHDDEPLVSIIIPNKDNLEYLEPCIDSILTKTNYENFELIVVDNQSVDQDTQAYYQDIQNAHTDKVKVADYSGEYNFSAMCNKGVEKSKGDYILFLNNDVRIIQVEWLERMMQHAQREDIGVVGARLVSPETGLIRHAGVVLGLNGSAESPFSGSDFKEPNYMNRAQVEQNYSAVTAGCLLTKRTVYDAVHKMDEDTFPVSYNHVDFCLKVTGAGYRVLWTPYATLIHHGSVAEKLKKGGYEERLKSANELSLEKFSLLKKWGSRLANDPAYNPNLSLTDFDFRVEVNLPRNWDINFHDRMRILGLPVRGGSGEYRVVQPFEAISSAGLAQCEHYRLTDRVNRDIHAVEVMRMQPDVIMVQAAIDDLQMKLLDDVNTLMPEIFRIFTLDDLITLVPEKSAVYEQSKRHFPDARRRLRTALSHCQRLIVTTQPLADYCVDLIEDIRVIPNRLSRDPWTQLTSLRSQGEKPRVGWVGAQQHQGDIGVVIEVVKQTADEIDWIFMGMCPEEIRPYVSEYHKFVPIDEYPEKMAGLNLDLAIAPLEQNEFNESKSNLRLLEYGVLGWPVICTDIAPYQSYGAPVTRVENTTDAWLNAIRNHINNPEIMAASGNRLKQWVLDNFIIEDNLDEWFDAVTPPGRDVSQAKLLSEISA